MKKIICNPMNLPYRFQEIEMGGRAKSVSREAADPSLVWFHDRYYLFASMTGGFFWSFELYDWMFVETPDLPVYDYAPDVRQIGAYLYFSASRRNENCIIYRSKNPIEGEFEEISSPFPFWDPNLFEDEDGRVYFYWGCASDAPLYGVEMNPNTMQPIGDPVGLIYGNPDEHGWERTGVNNDPGWFEDEMSEMIAKHTGTAPFIEGAWMTKYAGKYYLQYAAPATERNTYADGVYVGESPLGAFTYAVYNPISAKPGGFITGGGHGSTLKDKHENWWHISTMRIGINHMYERRLGFFPCGFDTDGILFCNQNFSDYPMVLTDEQRNPWDTFAGMMLLSYKKPVSATSVMKGYSTDNITDENIRTRWTAHTNAVGEAVTLDLLEIMTVEAIQINFAEHDIYFPERNEDFYFVSAHSRRYINQDAGSIRYLLEGSVDKEKWDVIEDKTEAATDLPHDFIVLPKPELLRYIRLTGYEMPYGGHFSLSGLRIFGKGNGKAPRAVKHTTQRISSTSVQFNWRIAENAVGYNIRYGVAPDKLYHSWMIYEQTSLALNCLNAGVTYYACVDSFNENGITEGKSVLVAE